ncbi:MAG: alpha/beta hydrolase [Sphingomonadales bacterium]|nr:alpha/beta hydrolase [Sphingomonadales bacterium]NCQ22257.1 alpha/beta hydrolase [Sphingomonadales bacterium]NCT03615.1 alpha/beta hydrolase [Sphingomonadales bacterium]
MNTARPQPATCYTRVNGIDLAVHEWASDGTAVPLVFAHATGFQGRVFDAIIEAFPDHPAYAVDLRGHGLSRAGPIDDWRLLASDVADFLAQAGITGAVGIGHSMGAHTLLQVAADAPARFSRLVLFDPVILAPAFYAPGQPLYTAENPHPAIRRKRDFASVEAMIERFGTRDPYSLFDRRVFADYCRHGLTPAAAGQGLELACAPEVEASVYASSRSNGAILEAARHVDIPVLVVRAQATDLNDFKSSPTWPDLASILPQGSDLYRPDMTHFHPFQDPQDAARIIAEWIA